MADFDTFLKALRNEFGEQLAGKKFEIFCKWFLECDPEWSKTVRKVWLWSDYPNKWQRQDLGTDLVFEDMNGRIWAVQAKCYGEEYATTKEDVNSFIADSSRRGVDRRLWIQTTDKIRPTAEKTLRNQDKPVTVFRLKDFRNANVNYPKSFSQIKKTKPKQKPEPDPHQVKAIKEAVAGLKNHDRGQMIMACGTGKTFTTLWVKEALNSQTTLVLLPSLNLLSQTLQEWTWAASDHFDILNVCSDKSVGASEDMEVDEAPFPVTSDVSEITAFLKNPSKKVLFCTYQSSHLIAKAQRDESILPIDLTIADEAHRCAGGLEADFSNILDNNKIRSDKRLFTTATPRYFGKAITDAAKQRDIEIVGMDNEDLFGPVIHKLTFGEAIDRKLLNDYQVVIVGVDEPRIKSLIDNYEIVKSETGTETDARTLAAQIGLVKAVKDHNLRRVISFHSRVRGAKDFSETFAETAKIMKPSSRPSGKGFADYVSGSMKTGERADKIRKLKALESFDRGLLCNARCLSEGVDVPSLDGIAFIDPRGSQIDIIQAVGRAIRKVRGSRHQAKGTIVIPVFIEKGATPEVSIENSKFKPVWDVLNALRAHDEVLAEIVDNYRIGLARSKNHKKKRIDKVIFDLPISVGKDFAASLRTVLVEKTTSSWEFWFTKLEQYRKKHGDCLVPHRYITPDGYKLGNWVAGQRGHKHRRTGEQIDRLDALGFVWHKYEYQFKEGLNALENYVAENGDCLVPHKYKTPDGFKLGQWVTGKRTRKSELTQDKIDELDALGFIWNVLEYEWEKSLAALKKYREENGDCLVPHKYKTPDGFKLGQWVNNKRARKALHTQERIDKLDAIGFIWDRLEYEWNKGFAALQNYKDDNGDCLVPVTYKTSDGFKLGGWVVRQRQSKALTQKKIERLDALEFVWHPNDYAWELGIQALIKYKEKNGDYLVPARYITCDGIKLGQWVNVQRSNRVSLPPDRLKRLNEIGFIWDANEHLWEQGIQALTQYKKENYDCLVPAMYMSGDFNLGSWVVRCRTRKKENQISPQKIAQLEKMGFVWSQLDAQWMTGIKALEKYRGDHGNCLVPATYTTSDGYSLGGWVSRARARKHKLSQKRIKQLDNLEFVWSVKKPV